MSDIFTIVQKEKELLLNQPFYATGYHLHELDAFFLSV